MKALILPRLRHDQLEIALHPAKRKYLACGRRWGKTVLGGVLVANVLRQHGSAAWISPTYKNSRPMWRWIKNTVRPLPEFFKLNEAERTIETHRSGLLGVYSADNIDSVRGERFHLVVIDEGARVSGEDIQEVVIPTLADYDGELLVITSPKGINWFSEEWDAAHLQMDSEAAAWRYTTLANPMPTIQKAYHRAKDYLPDRIFRQEWDAEFVTAGGQVFDRAWFTQRYASVVPVGRYISFDTAAKEKQSNDFTAWSVGELDASYKLYLRECEQERLTLPNLTQRILDVATRWNRDGKLNAVIIEDKSSGTGALQTLQLSAPDWLKPLLVAFQPQGDKVARAGQAGVWCRNGMVLLPAPSPEYNWLYEFERELFSFPDVVHDDRTDSFDQLVIYLENLLAAGYEAKRLAARRAGG